MDWRGRKTGRSVGGSSPPDSTIVLKRKKYRYNTENEWSKDSDEYGAKIAYLTREEFERIMKNRGKEYQCLTQGIDRERI